MLGSMLEALWHAALDHVGWVQDSERVGEVANGHIRNAFSGKGCSHGAPTIKKQVRGTLHCIGATSMPDGTG